MKNTSHTSCRTLRELDPQAAPEVNETLLSFIKLRTLKEGSTSMEEIHHYRGGETHHAIPGKSVLYGLVAGIAVGGPLLGTMGFSFMAAMTLLLIASPLLLIFSPLLICAAFVVACAVAGFSIFAAVAAVGVATLGWVLQQLGHAMNRTRLLGRDSTVDKLVDGRGVAME